MKQGTFLLSLLLCITTCSLQLAQPQAPFPMPTEEELLKMNQEIDKFRMSLSPKERAEFDREVEDLAKKMEKMDEKELTNFIDEIFNAETMPPMPQPAEQPVIERPQPVVEEPIYKKTDVPAKTIEAARLMLTSITTSIESFLRKANLIPDLYGSLDSWVPAAMLADKKDLTWEQLKKDIELVNRSMHTLLDHDPETGHYYYLGSLVGNDALYANIIRLHDALRNDEPRVEAPKFGLGDITKASKTATSSLLATFTQIIYSLHLNKEIQKLLAGFEPEAKKVRESEESARKKATEESRAVRTQAPMRSGGAAYTASEYGATGYQDGGYPSSYQGTRYQPASPSRPSDLSSPQSEAHKKDSTGQQKKSTTDDKTSADKKKKEEEQKTPKFDTKPIEKTVESIESGLEDVISLITRKQLNRTINHASQANIVEEAAGKINLVVTRINKLERLTKSLPTQEKRLYMDRVRDVVTENKNLFDEIITEAHSANELRLELEAMFKKLSIGHARRTVSQKAEVKKVMEEKAAAPVLPKATLPVMPANPTPAVAAPVAPVVAPVATTEAPAASLPASPQPSKSALKPKEEEVIPPAPVAQ